MSIGTSFVDYCTTIQCIIFQIKKKSVGNSLAVQWLGLHTFTAGGLGSIPGQETIRSCKPHSVAKKKKKKVNT